MNNYRLVDFAEPLIAQEVAERLRRAGIEATVEVRHSITVAGTDYGPAKDVVERWRRERARKDAAGK